MLRLRCGESFISLERVHCEHSELLSSLYDGVDEDGEEDVPELPAFVGNHFSRLPSFLKLVSDGSVEAWMRGTTKHANFKDSLEWLKTCEFLDVSVAVQHLFQYIRQCLSRCRTVDDLVELLFDPAEWAAMGVDERRMCYDMLFTNFVTLTCDKGVTGIPEGMSF